MTKLLLSVLMLSLSWQSCNRTQRNEKPESEIHDSAATSVTTGKLSGAKALAEFSANDTANLKCYINTYTLPYHVKIFNTGYRVEEKDFPSFIASQKNELQKYRVYLLTTHNNGQKKTTDVTTTLAANNIIDFEIIEDGKASR